MFFFHDIKSSRIYQEIVMVTDNMNALYFDIVQEWTWINEATLFPGYQKIIDLFFSM